MTSNAEYRRRLVISLVMATVKIMVEVVVVAAVVVVVSAAAVVVAEVRSPH